MGDFYSPQTRFWELLVGAILAYATIYPQRWPFRISQVFAHTQSIIGFVLICASTIFFNKSLAFPGWWALLPVLGSVMLIYAGPNGIVNRTLLHSSPMVWIGLISYPLYLWHWPILSLARVYFGQTLTASYASIALCASFVFAWLIYKFIEQPIRRSVNGGIKLLILILTVFGIGLAAYFTKEANGLASRFNISELQRANQLTGCDNIIKDGILYPCTFGNQASDQTILIYGDSHAGHLTSALNQELGSQNRFIFLGFGDCLQSKVEGADKDKICQLMWGEVRKLRNQKLYAVVHAQRWGDLVPQNEKDDMRHAFLAAGLSPQKIAIVGSIPDVDLDCEIANYYVSSRKKSCPRFENQYKKSSIFIVESKKMTTPKNVQFFYPYEKLCPNDVCTVINGSVSNYWDDRHMSRDGALMSTPDLIEYLRN